MDTIPSIYDTAMQAAQAFYAKWQTEPFKCRCSLQEALRMYAYIQRGVDPIAYYIKEDSARALLYALSLIGVDKDANNSEQLAAYTLSALWYLASDDEKCLLMIEEVLVSESIDS
jgi:hypothetical protein